MPFWQGQTVLFTQLVMFLRQKKFLRDARVELATNANVCTVSEHLEDNLKRRSSYDAYH